VYLGQSDSSDLVWAGGAPVADVPPPPAPTFQYACIYSDGSQELVSDPSNCPTKDGLSVVEVDDLSQVSPGTTQPTTTPPPAITVNVPSLPPISITPPTLPTISLPSLPPILQTPAPTVAPPAAPPSSFPWWLLFTAAGLLFGGATVERRRHRVSR
jgi:hypothetical protein